MEFSKKVLASERHRQRDEYGECDMTAMVVFLSTSSLSVGGALS